MNKKKRAVLAMWWIRGSEHRRPSSSRVVEREAPNIRTRKEGRRPSFRVGKRSAKRKLDGEDQNKAGSVYVFRIRSPHGRSSLEQGRRAAGRNALLGYTEKRQKKRGQFRKNLNQPGLASPICVRGSSLANIRTNFVL